MFYDKFKPEELLIKEFNYWVVLLREKQQTLGDAVILLKEEKPSISLATEQEFAEFPLVVEWYEKKCKELFGAEKFNYNCAMMKDNYVHFHAFARYSDKRTFADMEWLDVDWPRPIKNAVPVEFTEKVRDSLLVAFKN